MPIPLTTGVDFAYGAAGDGPAIAAAGHTFVMRYVPYPGAAGKEITAAQIEEYRAAGLDIGLVFESWPQRPLEGFNAGREDAGWCLVAQDILGLPAAMAFYFAIDFDTIPDHLDEIEAYFRGVLTRLPFTRVGVYGEGDVVDYCLGIGVAKYAWQTKAWSGNYVSEAADILQHLHSGIAPPINGHPVDGNVAYTLDFGQWPGEDELDRESRNAVFGTDNQTADYRIAQRLPGGAADGTSYPPLIETVFNVVAETKRLAEAVSAITVGADPSQAVAEILERLGDLSTQLAEAAAAAGGTE